MSGRHDNGACEIPRGSREGLRGAGETAIPLTYLLLAGRRAVGSGSRQSPAPANQDGYVTAETAMVLPTLVGLGLALTLIVVAAAAQLRCTDAAWEAARGVARGEAADYAMQTVHRLGPAGASADVKTSGGTVIVRVSARLSLGSGLLPAIGVAGHAQIACEPGTVCAAEEIGAEVR